MMPIHLRSTDCLILEASVYEMLIHTNKKMVRIGAYNQRIAKEENEIFFEVQTDIFEEIARRENDSLTDLINELLA